jgi:hypothetical protein
MFFPTSINVDIVGIVRYGNDGPGSADLKSSRPQIPYYKRDIITKKTYLDLAFSMNVQK